MTWEEIGKKYENEKHSIPLIERTPALDKKWGRLVRSTDKLIWLFAVSGGLKSAALKNHPHSDRR